MSRSKERALSCCPCGTLLSRPDRPTRSSVCLWRRDSEQQTWGSTTQLFIQDEWQKSGNLGQGGHGRPLWEDPETEGQDWRCPQLQESSRLQGLLLWSAHQGGFREGLREGVLSVSSTFALKQKFHFWFFPPKYDLHCQLKMIISLVSNIYFARDQYCKVLFSWPLEPYILVQCWFVSEVQICSLKLNHPIRCNWQVHQWLIKNL